jgi:hypothetical protein
LVTDDETPGRKRVKAMAFIYHTRTVHCPVSAVGCEIRNAFGVTVATATDTWQASAIAALINAGHGPVKKMEDAHDYGEEVRREQILWAAKNRQA